jgi:hypothetical protein
MEAVLTGTSSVDTCAVMAREPVKSFYCTNPEKSAAAGRLPNTSQVIPVC